MSSKNLLKFFIEKGFLLDKETLDFFNEIGDENVIKEIFEKISLVAGKKLITKNLIVNNLDKIKPIFTELDREKKKIIEKYFFDISVSVKVRKETEIEKEEQSEEKIETKKEIRNNVKVLSSPIMVSQKLEVKDFVKHFKNRYLFMKSLLQQRPELENLISIDKIPIFSSNRVFSIIGIVNDKIITKNKNVILEVEDLTGRVRLLINQNKKEIFEKSKEILLDDVVGFKCSGTKEFLFVIDFFYPDAYLLEKHWLDNEIYAIFVSDFHVGSKNFLEDKFEKFIEWLEGKSEDKLLRKLAERVRYMFVLGDSVDGVGVYPGQEKDLKIKDIKKQYEKLASFYRRIPERITIIQCPGQHDAVRVAEPQPPPEKEFAEPLYEIKNLYLVSNPSLVEIGGEGSKRGIKVLMYHGASMHSIINNIEELRLGNAHATPAKVVKHLLKRRHLAPTHSDVLYIPNKKEDPLLIKEIPNIIATGDLHKADLDQYNNIQIICSSCWQSITAFEEKVGNQPDLCKVPIINLKTGAVKILDFSDGLD